MGKRSMCLFEAAIFLPCLGQLEWIQPDPLCPRNCRTELFLTAWQSQHQQSSPRTFHPHCVFVRHATLFFIQAHLHPFLRSCLYGLCFFFAWSSSTLCSYCSTLFRHLTLPFGCQECVRDRLPLGKSSMAGYIFLPVLPSPLWQAFKQQIG